MGPGSAKQRHALHRVRDTGSQCAAALVSAGKDCERESYSEKLVPQPQEEVACGFSILNEAPIRSSTKSICEPLR